MKPRTLHSAARGRASGAAAAVPVRAGRSTWMPGWAFRSGWISVLSLTLAACAAGPDRPASAAPTGNGVGSPAASPAGNSGNGIAAGPAAGTVSATSATSGAPSAITQIGLERDCFGCATGTRVLLHRDGRAELTITGKARHRTVDRPLHGRIEPQQFEALARLVLEADFFALEPLYEEPDLQDGAWATIRVGRGGDIKEVFRREQAGPEGLARLEAAIEAAIEAAQARSRFEPVGPGR
jgi:hypothetical protein